MKGLNMKRTAVVLSLFLCLASGCGQKLRAQDQPKLSDSGKLKIRNAQVEFLTAQSAVQNSQEYKNLQTAQAALNATVADVMKDEKIDQAKYRLDEKLNLTSIAPPPPSAKAPEKAPEKK